MQSQTFSSTLTINTAGLAEYVVCCLNFAYSCFQPLAVRMQPQWKQCERLCHAPAASVAMYQRRHCHSYPHRRTVASVLCAEQPCVGKQPWVVSLRNDLFYATIHVTCFYVSFNAISSIVLLIRTLSSIVFVICRSSTLVEPARQIRAAYDASASVDTDTRPHSLAVSVAIAVLTQAACARRCDDCTAVTHTVRCPSRTLTATSSTAR